MRLLAAVAALLITALLGGTAGAAPAPYAARKAPDLVARGGSVAYADGQLTVKLKFRNKGAANAAKSVGAFAVSKDKSVSDDDRGIATVKVPAIKKGKGVTVKATVAVPDTVPDGRYYVVYCADYKVTVPEGNEGNNCGATGKSVKITAGSTTTPPPASTVTISAVAGAGGIVTASTSGGTCTGLSCRVPAGAGSVTFTPSPAAGYTFQGWSGCSGYTGSPVITFSNPVANATCAAAFTATTTTPPPPPASYSTIAFSASGSGTVSGAVTAGTGTCSASSCSVLNGAATVVLTAKPAPLYAVKSWSAPNGAVCDGTVSANKSTITFTNATAAKSCTATITLFGV